MIPTSLPSDHLQALETRQQKHTFGVFPLFSALKCNWGGVFSLPAPCSTTADLSASCACSPEPRGRLFTQGARPRRLLCPGGSFPPGVSHHSVSRPASTGVAGNQNGCRKFCRTSHSFHIPGNHPGKANYKHTEQCHKNCCDYDCYFNRFYFIHKLTFILKLTIYNIHQKF